MTGIYAPSDNTPTHYERYDLRTDGTAFYEFKDDDHRSFVVDTVNGAGSYEIHGENVLVTMDDKYQVQFAGVPGVTKDEQTNWVDHVNIIFKIEGDDLLLTEREGSVYASPKRYVKQK